eukprot:10536752-Ditylum_brightwellii.AAC.1
MDKDTMDMRATSSYLCKNLTELDVYMAMVNNNTNLSHQYVKENQQGLMARGESIDNLMTNL